MKGYKSLLIILIILATSCNKSPEKMEREYFSSAIKQVKVNNDCQWIVVLPGLGCHGCIQEAEYFMKEHIADERILFILTKISSLKILQQKTEILFSEHSNVYIDRDNLFDISTDNSIYPCIIQLKGGEILKHSFQSPSNAAFHQMEQELAGKTQ